MARKILLADDSVTAQNMGRKILVDAGYDVLTVNNGSAALKRITETKPDLIILDVYMPGYSGLEVCQRLKDSAETAHIPVLLSVGKLEPFKPQEARRVKANAHIVKPFEASELLSAIACLEDGIVPQSHKPNFCSPLPNADNFGEDSSPTWETKTETGRKSSRGAKKKESEAEEAVPNFRDFRKVKGKAAEVEASIAAEMPRDITKEELDALSAVAAKLDGSVAPASGHAGQIDGSVEESAQVSAPSANLRRRASDRAEEVSAAAAITPAAEIPVTEPVAPVEMPVVALDAVESAVAAGNQTENQQVESPNQVAAVESPVEASPAEVQVVESLVAESQTSEAPVEKPKAVEPPAAEIQKSQEVTAEAAVNTGLLAEAPAPVDQQDEPMFASAVVEEKVETPTVEAEEPVVHAVAQAEEAKEEAKEEKSEPVEIKAAETTAVEEPEVPVVAASAETVEGEAPAPSDEELAEALRLLTPATAYAEATVSSSQAQMNDAGCDAPNGSHWMAEAVGLSPEEAAMSLEEEMFRTFATAPAGESDSTPVAGRVSTITAAVENRLAEVARLSEASSEEAPKAMAAAAAAETSTAGENPTPGCEEIAIASIVDKVLADLRPKIVEEIAKKLGQGH